MVSSFQAERWATPLKYANPLVAQSSDQGSTQLQFAFGPLRPCANPPDSKQNGWDFGKKLKCPILDVVLVNYLGIEMPSEEITRE